MPIMEGSFNPFRYVEVISLGVRGRINSRGVSNVIFMISDPVEVIIHFANSMQMF